jgi:flagellar capping protein FliD
MLKAGETEIHVVHNLSAVSSALSGFASAYNAAIDEIDKHRGKDAGALSGSSLLSSLQSALRELTGYDAGGDGIRSLISLGLNFDDKGKLTLDMSAFQEAAGGEYAALDAFLGGSATGGFLQTASDVMNSLEDTTGGVIHTAMNSLTDQLAWQDTRIADEQTRIDQLQENLVARMAAADALIASMERQVQYLTGLFESMRSLQGNQ